MGSWKERVVSRMPSCEVTLQGGSQSMNTLNTLNPSPPPSDLLLGPPLAKPTQKPEDLAAVERNPYKPDS